MAKATAERSKMFDKNQIQKHLALTHANLQEQICFARLILLIYHHSCEHNSKDCDKIC